MQSDLFQDDDNRILSLPKSEIYLIKKLNQASSFYFI